MTLPRMSPSRFARLHNEALRRAEDELSFEQPEKPSALRDDEFVSPEVRRNAVFHAAGMEALARKGTKILAGLRRYSK